MRYYLPILLIFISCTYDMGIPDQDNILYELQEAAHQFNAKDFEKITAKEAYEICGVKRLTYDDTIYYLYPSVVMAAFNEVYKRFVLPDKDNKSDCDNRVADYVVFLSRFLNYIPNSECDFFVGRVEGEFSWGDYILHKAIVFLDEGKVPWLFEVEDFTVKNFQTIYIIEI